MSISPKFWQLLTDTSIESKASWVWEPKLPNDGEKNPKNSRKTQTREKGFYSIGENSWLCSISEDHHRSENSSALSHFTIIWFQIKDIDCFARCEEEEKISLETMSSLHCFNRSKKSIFYLQKRAGTDTFQYMKDFRAH